MKLEIEEEMRWDYGRRKEGRRWWVYSETKSLNSIENLIVSFSIFIEILNVMSSNSF